MIGWFLVLFSAFLVFTESAGVLNASGAEPLGAGSSCGEVPHQFVEITRSGYAPGLNDGPSVRPVVLPSNLEVAGVFRPFLDKMWQASPTFRGQWRRLAAGTGVRVSVLVEDLPRPASSSKARTVLTHQDGSLVSAHVYLKPSLDAAELIAHEMEHILEQLDCRETVEKLGRPRRSTAGRQA